MKKNNRLITTLAIAIAATFSSCQKGATGPAGANGTANISSTIYTITPGSWGTASGGYTTTVADAAISNANADGVEMFISSTTSGPWLGLPATNLLTSSGDTFDYAYSNGSIQFGYLYSSAPTVTLYVKVVVIPPAVMKQHPNTNWKDYNQVQSILDSQKSN